MSTEPAAREDMAIFSRLAFRSRPARAESIIEICESRIRPEGEGGIGCQVEIPELPEVEGGK